MNRTVFALLLSVSAIAQAPIIQSITPDRGADTGGTSVSIRGVNLTALVSLPHNETQLETFVTPQ